MAKAQGIAALAVGCALIAGCGGSTSTRLSAGELASKGAAICAQAGVAEKNIQGSDAAVALPPILAREITELGRLAPPAAEQGSYATLLEDFSQLEGLLQSLSSAVARTGGEPPEILSRGAAVAARADAVAGQLGLSTCTSPS
jgi:hypothetical protein